MLAEDRALKVWQTRRIETVLMKWDGIPGNLGHIMPTIKVNSDMWTENVFKNLQRLNGDSELEPKPCHEYGIMSRHSVMFGHGVMHLDLRLAAALLIVYWHKENDNVLHWMKREMSNLVLEFFPYGIGSNFDLEKFGALIEFRNNLSGICPIIVFALHRFPPEGVVEAEERDRSVIGLTASNKCLVLASMVDSVMSEMGGASEEAAIQSLLAKGGKHMQGWLPGLDCIPYIVVIRFCLSMSCHVMSCHVMSCHVMMVKVWHVM